MARLPVRLYQAGLGPLFGKRLLLLHHTGHLTGLHRRVVLEVITYERSDDRLSWTVASGFGPAAAWYQSLRHFPWATVQFGNLRYAATASLLPPETGGDIMTRYAAGHPRLARRLCAFKGFRVDGSPAAFRRVGNSIPFVRLDAIPGDRIV
ncbi:nitroreductase/quinone reductase family protein [Streptomyces sp. NPDC058989]|uniref:nitroreductase/quinone reductase family protein n=1 Tax=Streptomyces sp. NPDC058989 TaxID=3346686 RepID=UPI0036B5326A